MCQVPLRRYRQKIAEPRKVLVAVETGSRKEEAKHYLYLMDS